jgi:hypothetical protein
MRGMLTVPALIYILVVLGSKLRIICAMQPSPGLAAGSKICVQACRHSEAHEAYCMALGGK